MSPSFSEVSESPLTSVVTSPRSRPFSTPPCHYLTLWSKEWSVSYHHCIIIIISKDFGFARKRIYVYGGHRHCFQNGPRMSAAWSHVTNEDEGNFRPQITQLGKGRTGIQTEVLWSQNHRWWDQGWRERVGGCKWLQQTLSGFLLVNWAVFTPGTFLDSQKVMLYV